MSRRSHGKEGMSAILKGGVSVCIPLLHKHWNVLRISLPSILDQEPDEVIVVNQNHYITPQLCDFIDRMRGEYPKTKILFEHCVDETISVVSDYCTETITQEHIFWSMPYVVHGGYLIQALLCASSKKEITLPRIITCNWGYAASLPPLGLHNYRVRELMGMVGDYWNQSDVVTLARQVDEDFDVLLGAERPLPYFHCAGMHKDVWKKLGGFKTNSIYDDPDTEMIMSMFANGIRIRGSGDLMALAIPDSHGLGLTWSEWLAQRESIFLETLGKPSET